MFNVKFSVSKPIGDGYKETICRIFRMYEYKNRQHEEGVVKAIALWNDEQDEYDLEIGKREALIKAYYGLPKSAQTEFDEWLENL